MIKLVTTLPLYCSHNPLSGLCVSSGTSPATSQNTLIWSGVLVSREMCGVCLVVSLDWRFRHGSEKLNRSARVFASYWVSSQSRVTWQYRIKSTSNDSKFNLISTKPKCLSKKVIFFRQSFQFNSCTHEQSSKLHIC